MLLVETDISESVLFHLDIISACRSVSINGVIKPMRTETIFLMTEMGRK